MECHNLKCCKYKNLVVWRQVEILDREEDNLRTELQSKIETLLALPQPPSIPRPLMRSRSLSASAMMDGITARPGGEKCQSMLSDTTSDPPQRPPRKKRGKPREAWNEWMFLILDPCIHKKLQCYRVLHLHLLFTYMQRNSHTPTLGLQGAGVQLRSPAEWESLCVCCIHIMCAICNFRNSNTVSWTL